MTHTILTFSTMAAVALHAMAGCCAHHTHACGSHQHEMPLVASDGDHCHGHHCHNEHSTSGDHFGDQHQGDDDPCDQPACSFVTAEGCDSVAFVLSLGMWMPMPGDATTVTPLNGSLGYWAGTESPPGHLLSPEPLRAQTQVWLL